MRASLRWKDVLLAGLIAMPLPALAQSAPDPASTTAPATDAVGPQELQNFTLSGSVSKPADQQPGPSSALSPSQASPPAANDRLTPAPAQHPAREVRQSRAIAVRSVAPTVSRIPADKAADTSGAGLTATTVSAQVGAPAVGTGATPPPAQSATFPETSIPATSALAPEHKLLVWPWLLAAFALAGAILLLLLRRRQQAAFAGTPNFERFVAPEPAPAPVRPIPPAPRAPVPPPPATAPAAAPPRGKSPASNGIVSTRLRPALEIGAQPLRCLLEDERVILEFELELFNSGTAPARAVIAEASLFNAGGNQEQELGSFFANPVGAGERLDVILPMKRMSFINQVVAPRAAIQEYELGGRKVFVPLLAFNALYMWSGGEAQTSVAYLVGRETGGDKLGPLSLDSGPREIGKLAARPLPTALRT